MKVLRWLNTQHMSGFHLQLCRAPDPPGSGSVAVARRRIALLKTRLDRQPGRQLREAPGPAAPRPPARQWTLMFESPACCAGATCSPGCLRPSAIQAAATSSHEATCVPRSAKRSAEDARCLIAFSALFQLSQFRAAVLNCPEWNWAGPALFFSPPLRPPLGTCWDLSEWPLASLPSYTNCRRNKPNYCCLEAMYHLHNWPFSLPKVRHFQIHDFFFWPRPNRN